jgi:chorismate synthase
MALTLSTAGESHGPGLTALVEGLPAGLEHVADVVMARRQLGFGRGGRMKIETDTAEVRSGVRHGRTLGGPVALWVVNRDYQNWEERMNPWPVEAEVPPVHMPRPGHADMVGVWKYGHDDVRNVLERASARETAARVAGGTLAKAFLRALGVEIRSHVTQIGPVHAPTPEAPLTLADFEGIDDDPVRTLDAATSKAMVQHITVQRKANESIGGCYEVLTFGLHPGIGSHVSWQERLDGRLAQAICSIQAHKGVEFGDGFKLAETPGSLAQDEIFGHDDAAEGDEPTGAVRRRTHHAGGLEGGMTTGQTLTVRAAVKPIPTITKPLRSVDLSTGEPAKAMIAMVLASAYREKFGGDHIDDVKAAVAAYEQRIGWTR